MGTSRYRSTTTPICVVFWRDTVLQTCASTLNIPVVHRENRSRGPMSERGCFSTKAPGVANTMEHAMGYKQITHGFSSLRPWTVTLTTALRKDEVRHKTTPNIPNIVSRVEFAEEEYVYSSMETSTTPLIQRSALTVSFHVHCMGEHRHAIKRPVQSGEVDKSAVATERRKYVSPKKEPRILTAPRTPRTNSFLGSFPIVGEHPSSFTSTRGSATESATTNPTMPRNTVTVHRLRLVLCFSVALTFIALTLKYWSA